MIQYRVELKATYNEKTEIVNNYEDIVEKFDDEETSWLIHAFALFVPDAYEVLHEEEYLFVVDEPQVVGSMLSLAQWGTGDKSADPSMEVTLEVLSSNPLVGDSQ